MTVPIEGFVHPDFKPVRRALKNMLKDTRGGAAVTVYHRGRCVADIWGGLKDEQGNPWEKDTASVSFSTTKGVSSTALHVLADRGLLRYDDPVCKHWPEFAQSGKEEITIRHVLCHQAGLYNIRELVDDAGRMLDWEHMTEKLAAAAPSKEARTRSAYHGLTYGWLVGEIVRRIAKKPFSEFIRDELAKPLGLDGLYIGAPPEALRQAARLVQMGDVLRKRSGRGGSPDKKKQMERRVSTVQGILRFFGVPLNARRTQAALAPRGISNFDFSSDEVLKASIPAANGLFTARSLARLYGMLAGKGELEGTRLVSEKTVWALNEIQTTDFDRVVPIPMHWRLGYHRAWTTRGSPRKAFGHYGFGGSGAWCDPERNLSCALVLNSGVGTPFGDIRTARIGGVALACANGR
ncbi:MAG: serine hydrolase domain-containing protein [Bdellovibrionota bacterium]